MGTPNPVSKEMELHNTWLVRYKTLFQLPFADLRKADGLKHYVDWAVKQGYAVIDVNIPKHLPGVDVWFNHAPIDYLSADSSSRLPMATRRMID